MSPAKTESFHSRRTHRKPSAVSTDSKKDLFFLIHIILRSPIRHKYSTKTRLLSLEVDIKEDDITKRSVHCKHPASSYDKLITTASRG